MALIHSCMRLMDEKVIVNFQLYGSKRATLQLMSGTSINIYMSDDYIIGIPDIVEAVEGDPYPDYFVYNQWDEVTDEANSEAKRRRLPLIHFNGLLAVLRKK